ncbi:hypothetical protein E3Q22_03212 [Wallemia mellicola]|uniref:F-box domain-containing protein n=1 Tax=Wallemia mellicola TaxID=1708541 RepID=A0A4V4MPF4_9BASI|nr:hypothetical protein E3Q22_03212 [Wallemia mellicola]TIC10803.1 hypothetical protein E3Q14_02612 [Wallemia mellicola]TIC52253.1 hypothetical protein E3Q05_02828 [Wallemia mellicola]
MQNTTFKLLNLPIELIIKIIEKCQHNDRLSLLSTCHQLRDLDKKYIFEFLKSPEVNIYTEDDEEGYELYSLTEQTLRNSISMLRIIPHQYVKSLKVASYCDAMTSREDLRKLSDRLTKYVSKIGKNLETFSYTKETIDGILLDSNAFENWLSNAPQLEELYLYCIGGWFDGSSTHDEVYRKAIEKLVQERSQFFLRISSIVYRPGRLVCDAIEYNYITNSVAKTSDFEDLLQHAKSYDIKEYDLSKGQLKLVKSYSRNS